MIFKIKPKPNKIVLLLLITIIVSGFSNFALAQIEEGAFRHVLTEEGAYIYHTVQVPIGDGFNIYKKTSMDSEFIQLNEQPVKGIFYPEALPGILGDLYAVLEDELQANSVSQTFFTLRSNAVLGRLYSFVYPEVASALGRLYLDETAIAGETVTYKMEFVDDLGRPTGEVLEEELVLKSVVAPAPADINLSNDGYGMEISWSYPPMQNEDDKIIRFEILESVPENDSFIPVNDGIILRDNARSEYIYYFDTNALRVEKEYIIAPVNIAGDLTSISETISFFIEDNIAPEVVQQVNAEFINSIIEVTWPVSPEPDLSGYKVYKSTSLADGTSLIQQDLINPLEPVYIDSEITEGEQYFYQITAVDESGNESPKSAAAMRSVDDITPPPTPGNFSAEYLENKTVQLSWETSNMPPDFRRFIVLRRKLSNSDPVAFDQIAGDDYRENRFSDTGISNIGFEEGAFYEFGILAADSSRNFSDTTFVLIQVPDLTAPQAPALVVAENRDGVRTDVNWLQSSSADVVSYNLTRQLRDSVIVFIHSVTVNERNYMDETVEKGYEYRYGVSAIDSSGLESDITFSEFVFARNYDPPRQVRNVRLRDTDSGLELFWEPVVSNQLLGYLIYRSDSVTGIYEPLTEIPITETNFTLNEVTGEFWYRIRAIDRSGNQSRPSEPVKRKR